MLYRIHPAKMQKMQNHETFLLMSYLQVFYTLSSFLVSKRAQWRGSFLHKRMHTGQTDIKIHTQEWKLEWTQVSADKQSGRHSSRVLGLRAELQRQSSRHLVGMRRHKRSSTQGEEAESPESGYFWTTPDNSRSSPVCERSSLICPKSTAYVLLWRTAHVNGQARS